MNINKTCFESAETWTLVDRQVELTQTVNSHFTQGYPH